VATRRDVITGVSEFADLGERGPAIGSLAPAPPPGGERSVEAFEPRRRAEPFEALRDATDRFLGQRGGRPRVFVANLGAGPPSERLAFAGGVFAAAGLEVVTDAPGADAGEAATAFRASGADVAALCGADAAYMESAASFASALRAAGARALVLIGAPGDSAQRYRAMGIDHFVHRGSDVLHTLGALVGIATNGAAL